MRRSEITSELINLSQKAKGLGFPQGVEEGDWVWDTTNKHPYVWDTGSSKLMWDILILSFSRCLEWFGNQGISVVLDNDRVNNLCICSAYPTPIDVIEGKAKTHHEAIAKAVVKILENHEG